MLTNQMLLALVITIFMIVLILIDKLPFGAPPLIACLLLVVTGTAGIEDAFSGFVDKNIIMIAGFMVVMAAFQKTTAISKIKQALNKMASKGGYRNYVLMILLIMVGAMFITGTAYYVLVLSLVATLPYNKNLPNSKLVAPFGFASYFALFPIQYAVFMGIANTLLDGVTATSGGFIIVQLVRSVSFLIWALIGYKLLPDHDISDSVSSQEANNKEEEVLNEKHEKFAYLALIVTVISLFFLNSIGEPGYAIPGLAAAFLLITGTLNFSEIRNNIASPMILMMAGVIGVSEALANSGFTAMVGDWVAVTMGSSMSPLVLVLIFTVMTSLAATFTGASFGSLFIFAPIGISICQSLGYNPTAMAIALTLAAWINWFMPIDGMPAMVMGIGKYKLLDFWKFTIPLWIIQIVVTVVAAVVLFPM